MKGLIAMDLDYGALQQQMQDEFNQAYIQKLEKEHPEANYTLHCGELSYEVTPEVQKTLEGVMYWCHCEKLDSAELRAAEKDKAEKGDKSAYSDEEIQKLKYEVEQEHLSIGDFMDKMEQQGVPNWVGNGAMDWAVNNDLREHSFREFFKDSDYAEKPEKQEEYGR